MLQTAFIIVLWAALAAAAVSFGLSGLAQRRRRDRLARAAHEAGMLFSADDLFDVPRQYAEFAAISGGHSARARNVTYGRLSGLAVRAFDFRCEIGHGVRRTGRHCGVIVVEAPADLPPMAMWNRRIAEHVPLAAGAAERRVGDWSCSGDRWACEAALDSEPARTASSMEARGALLLVCLPAGSSPAGVSGAATAAALAKRLCDRSAGGERSAGGDSARADG